MSLEPEISAVEAVASGGATIWVKVAFWAAVAFAVAAVVIWAGYRIFIAPMNAKHDLAAATGQAAVSSAGQQSAQQAGAIISGNGDKATKTDTVTRTNYVYITKQPGASDPVNPAVFDAFERAVCMRVSAAGLPECQRLRQPDPGRLEAGHP